MHVFISRDITLGFGFWSLYWGLFYLLLMSGIDYVTHPFVVAGFFAAPTASLLVLFGDLLRLGVSRPSARQWLLLASVLVVWVLTYILLPRVLPSPWALIEAHPDMFFLLFDWRYIFPKAFDILFQQILIALLTVYLIRNGVSLRAISLMCLVIFGAAHLYLVYRSGLLIGGYFVAFSMPAGWVFPRLIAGRQCGIVYAYSLHALFYIATGIFCRLCPTALL